MKNDNNQNELSVFNSIIDNIQSWIGVGSSVLPNQVSTTIENVNTLIDIQQEVNQSTGIPTWKISVANIAGSSAGATVAAVGGYISLEAALIAMGPIGLRGSAVLFFNGSLATIKLSDMTQQLTHDEVLRLLQSPGFIEAENYANNWARDLMNSLNDILARTTGWSQTPDWLNNLLNLYEDSLFGLRDLEEYLKNKIDRLNQDFKDIGNLPTISFSNINNAEQTQPVRVDPLVLDLDGDGIELISLNKSTTSFDLDEDGFKEKVGWLKADDGFVVLDSNHNNSIDNIRELFGYAKADGTQVLGSEELKTYDIGSQIINNITDAQGNIIVDKTQI
jgi:hypothetical protein